MLFSKFRPDRPLKSQFNIKKKSGKKLKKVRKLGIKYTKRILVIKGI